MCGRLFRIRSVTGRLWDDHFRHLECPSKFYRVQDAGFIDGSLCCWQIGISLMDENYASMAKDAVKFMLGRDRKLGQMESSHSGLRAWFGKGKKGGAGGGG